MSLRSSFMVLAWSLGLLLFAVMGCKSSSTEVRKANPRIEIGGFPADTEIFDLSDNGGMVTVVNQGNADCVVFAVSVEYVVEEEYPLTDDFMWVTTRMRGAIRVIPVEGLLIAPHGSDGIATIDTYWDRPYYESGTILITVHFRDFDGAERVVIRSVLYAYTKVVASG